MVLGVTNPRRGDVCLVSLDPTLGREIRKTRPALIVSPDQLNAHLTTYLVAPMTTGGRPRPFRVDCRFQGRYGFVVLDQMRTVDDLRLTKRLGRISPATLKAVLARLREMFEE